MRLTKLPSNHVLITGGAGFVGSHLADRLIDAGHQVRVLDNLSPQVHGPERRRPAYLNPKAELVVGDVRDEADVRGALHEIDCVVHLAASVGVGQSMYEVASYTSTNCLGTAVLMQGLIERPPERLIVASSMSIYGEGMSQDADGRLYDNASRSVEQIKRGDWAVRDDRGRELQPVPTPESKTPSLASIYALTKYDQEQMCRITGLAYGITTIALRLFNTYGTRQALSNPYTGVLAIFLSRLMNNNLPLVYEDGYQQRDFVSVHDVVSAFHLAIETPNVDESGAVFNIGSGQSHTIRDIAQRVADVVGRSRIKPRITNSARAGDIRNCFADITLAREQLGYEPRVPLDAGLEELAAWLDSQEAADHFDEANRELRTRGLTV